MIWNAEALLNVGTISIWLSMLRKIPTLSVRSDTKFLIKSDEELYTNRRITTTRTTNMNGNLSINAGNSLDRKTVRNPIQSLFLTYHSSLSLFWKLPKMIWKEWMELFFKEIRRMNTFYLWIIIMDKISLVL